MKVKVTPRRTIEEIMACGVPEYPRLVTDLHSMGERWMFEPFHCQSGDVLIGGGVISEDRFNVRARRRIQTRQIDTSCFATIEVG